jgi:uncharacterized membrane protein
MSKIEVGKSINYGWGKVKKDLWYFVGLSIVYLILTNFGAFFEDKMAFQIGVITFLIQTFLIGGLLKVMLSNYDGKKISIIEIFKQTKYFWRVLGAQLLLSIIIVFGFMLLIVPGIIWSLKYQFVLNLIVDKDMGVFEAMKKSGELTKGIKWQLLWFNFVCLGVIILGALVFGVGIFVAYPVVVLAEIYVYRKLLGA